MRISDWSSDVCSSDLPCFCRGRSAGGTRELFLRASDVACVRRVDGDQGPGLDMRRHHGLDAVLEDRRLVGGLGRLPSSDGVRLNDDQQSHRQATSGADSTIIVADSYIPKKKKQ